MAFPTTGLLDDFNRADAAGLGADWSEGDWLNANWEIVSNQCSHQGGDGDFSDAYWTAATFGGDAEIFATVAQFSANDNDELVFMARLTTPDSATMDGYLLVIRIKTAGTDEWIIRRLDNNSQTQLGSVATQDVSDGDRIGFEVIGSTLKGYHNSGGGWSEILSRSDATYSAAGNIGFFGESDGAGVAIDDFSGGTVVVGGAVAPRTLKMMGVGN